MADDKKTKEREIIFPIAKYKVSKEWIYGLFNEIKQAIMTEAIATDCSKEFLSSLNDLELSFTDDAEIKLKFSDESQAHIVGKAIAQSMTMPPRSMMDPVQYVQQMMPPQPQHAQPQMQVTYQAEAPQPQAPVQSPPPVQTPEMPSVPPQPEAPKEEPKPEESKETPAQKEKPAEVVPEEEAKAPKDEPKEEAQSEEPSQEEAVPEAPKAAEATEHVGGILVVDDERDMREKFKEVVEPMGITCYLDEDCEEGLENFKENKDNINIVVLPLVILQMLDQVDAMFKAFREVDEDIVLMFSTGSLETTKIPDILATADNVRFIEKPFKDDDIQKKVKRIFKIK